jgi:hypothetical protein
MIKRRLRIPMNFVDESLELLEKHFSPHEFLQKYNNNEEVILKNDSGIEITFLYSGSRYFTIFAKKEGYNLTPIFYINSDMY